MKGIYIYKVFKRKRKSYNIEEYEGNKHLQGKISNNFCNMLLLLFIT